MIKVKDLSKRYKNKIVVNRINFAVERGEAFALLGSNGAGKTTTIKMILKLVRPDTGEIHIEDGIKIGYSPETPYFPPFLTGAEVLGFYGKLQSMNKNEIKESTNNILEKVGLKNDNTKVKDYSKGMLQRLAFAQALLGNPELLIFDEPCAGLDAIGRLEIIQLINKLKEEGRTIIMNSHILSDIEKVCDRGIIMQEGQIIYRWSIEELTVDYTLEKMFLNVVGRIKDGYN